MENNTTLERNILGTMLGNDFLINDSPVKAEHFTSAVHRNIYQTMKHLVDKQQALDVGTLMATVDHLEQLGDLNYLGSLESYGNINKFDSWEQLLLEAYQQRTFKNTLQNAIEDDWELERTITTLSKLEQHDENDITTVYELARDMYDLPFSNKPYRQGVKTGLKGFDNLTSGLVNGELIIVAARPSVGKTQLMVNFAIGTQRRNENVIALIFSLEMNKELLSGRFVCNIGNINQSKLENPSQDFSDGQKEKWPSVIGEYSQMNIVISDQSNQTIAQIRSKVRRIIKDNPNKQVVVFLDYLTKIKADNQKAPKYMQIGQISNDLKSIARDFKIPVVCLAQLNRELDNAKDKRPMLSHLRDSGDIEQDADIVVLLHRDSYQDDTKQDDKTLELIVAKNRNGQTGKVFTEYRRGTGVIKDDTNSK